MQNGRMSGRKSVTLEFLSPEPCSLFIGVLGKEQGDFEEAKSFLLERWGPMVMEWGPHPFSSYTDYYHQEMGSPLFRWFVAFEGLISPESLVRIKNETRSLEAEYLLRPGLSPPCRRVNLDPGTLQMPRIVLASGKDHAHRLYLGEGIYGELTLLYEKKRWKSLPWTYPDYRSEAYHGFLSSLREYHRFALRSLKEVR